MITLNFRHHKASPPPMNTTYVFSHLDTLHIVMEGKGKVEFHQPFLGRKGYRNMTSFSPFLFKVRGVARTRIWVLWVQLCPLPHLCRDPSDCKSWLLASLWLTHCDWGLGLHAHRSLEASLLSVHISSLWQDQPEVVMVPAKGREVIPASWTQFCPPRGLLSSPEQGNSFAGSMFFYP